MVLLNKKTVKKVKAIKNAQKADKKQNRIKAIERGSILKRNIEKVAVLSSEELIGAPTPEKNSKLQIANASELIALIEAAGLTGMSGNGFSTAEKIKTFMAANKKNKTILINGAECEPALLHDAWLMKHFGGEIKEAAALLKKVLSAERVITAVRGNNAAEFDISGLVRLPLKYPMGEEHILIRQALGIELARDVIPATEGILVLNVQTVYQLWRIIGGCYDGGRFVTLTNLPKGEARIAYVDSKSGIKSALTKAFGKSNNISFAGSGIMSAVKIGDSECFNDKISFACLAEAPTVSNENKCRGCGGCSKKCPMGLSVKDIVLAKEKDIAADISAYKPEYCIHCGTCAYFCGAGKNPLAYIDGDKL